MYLLVFLALINDIEGLYSLYMLYILNVLILLYFFKIYSPILKNNFIDGIM